jgi:predicted RNA methylase
MTEGVFNCLIDKQRTLSFQKSIQNTVRKGDIVVDMGTGSGILAMFAVDAGAKKVYAVEWDRKNYDALRRTFDLNGYKDKIILIKGDVTKVTLPEKVDVIIGEMIATGLIEELQIPAMNNLLKYARHNVRVVLKAMENYVDLVYSNDNFYGCTMKIVKYEYPGEDGVKSVSRSRKALYKKVDFTKVNTDTQVKVKIPLQILRGGGN